MHGRLGLVYRNKLFFVSYLFCYPCGMIAELECHDATKNDHNQHKKKHFKKIRPPIYLSILSNKYL